MRNYARVNSIDQFRRKVMETLAFQEYPMAEGMIYENRKRPESGRIIRYAREGYYDIAIADYTFVDDLVLDFSHDQSLIRLGIVYTGNTLFKMEGEAVSGFSPSAFFAIENSPRGRQVWKKGQYFKGIEVAIGERYIREVIEGQYGRLGIAEEMVKRSFTYRYLSEELEGILHDTERLATAGRLDTLRMEGRMLDIVSVVAAEEFWLQKDKEMIEDQKIRVGSRYITLTSEDVETLQRAHQILQKEACNGLTIDELSNRTGMNAQKLKAGFTHLYRMTIWEFSNAVRMSAAAELLATTDKAVQEIAGAVGYASQAAFINMFRKQYQRSPKEYRLNHYNGS